MREKILIVDDDVNVLQGYQRQLRKLFNIKTATSGAEGLQYVLTEGPFAVILSDLRMPEMDGIQFLAEVRRHAPDSVRVMLSGNADLETCIESVNEGNVFRFLTKPCPPEMLAKTFQASIEHYRLIRAEKELLQGTLSGAIGLLTEIMSVMNPTAFSCAVRIRRYVRHMAAELNVDHFWHYDMAAALSQIGQVAMPTEILERLNTGRALTTKHRGIIARHPAIGCELLAKIPRLELVAQMVFRQNNIGRNSKAYENVQTDGQVVEFGALLLRLSLDLDQLIHQGSSFLQALQKIQSLYGVDHPLVEALMSLETTAEDRVVMEIMASDLSVGMVVLQDIVNHHGDVIVGTGQRITDPVLYRLQNCAQAKGVKEPFQVEVLSDAR